ncbi:hypothetical protein TrLO_g6671 [Triparma laevis f. longispina]|uniref:C2 domain-containing protein n=1 Tax=Triparma laevis f. longispina TaxID=1714387 RepID=A0A9W7E672_9STRA|nr:hypothetical protein TrLO_g6671 [Triparma laevis f. longispina]
MGKSKKEFVPRGAADAKAEDLKDKFYGATVNLTIKEAAGLIAMDSSFFNKKGRSDPYVKVTAEYEKGNNKKDDELAKTTTKKKTLSPLWDESFTIQLSEFHTPKLSFRLYDYDVGSSNDEMGILSIDLKKLAPNKINEKWHNVMPSPGCRNASGSLEISLSYMMKAAPSSVAQSKEMPDFLGGKVELHIIECKGLKAMDSSMFSKKGSSDPYVKMYIRDLVTTKLAAVEKTRILKKNLNPHFNSKHTFLMPKTSSSILHLQIYDHDMMSGDDPMGCAKLPLEKFLKRADYGDPLAFSIEPMEGCEDPTGTITCNLTFAPNLPDPHANKPFSGGLLLGVINRADNLLAVDSSMLSKASSDPYVKVSTDNISSDGKHKIVDVHKTAHKSGNLSPKYEELFCKDLSPFDSPSIEFSVWDNDRMSNDDPLGHVTVNVFDLIVLRDDKPVRYDKDDIPYVVKSYDILPVAGCVKAKGTLTLSLIFYPLFNTPQGFFGGNCEIKIIQASNLVAMDKSLFAKSATSSDPYISVCCPEGDRFKDNIVAKTKTVKKTLNPYFEQTFKFILSDNHYPYLNLKVYDWDAASGDDIIGKAVINLYNFDSFGEEVWVNVQPTDGCIEGQGQVKVMLNFERVSTPREEEFYGGMLIATVKEGKNLLAMDKSVFSTANSDPFVKLQGYKKGKGWAILSKGKNKSKLETYDKTKVVKKSLNPVWNHRLKAALTPQHLPVVLFSVFDHDDMSGDDPMGVVKINLNDYKDQEDKIEKWFNIMGCKGCPEPTGEVLLSFHWAPELSPEEKARRAEEARRKLYEKQKAPDREFTIDEMMEQAEVRVKELSGLREGQYFEDNHQGMKPIIFARSELDKVIEIHGDVLHEVQSRLQQERMSMDAETQEKNYFLDGVVDTSAPALGEGLAGLFGGGKKKAGGFAALMGGGGAKPAAAPATAKNPFGAAPNPLAALVPKKAGLATSPIAKRGSKISDASAAAFKGKHFDATKFKGAGIVRVAAGEKPKTPMVSVTRFVTSKSRDAVFNDPKQQYEKMIKGMEMRFKKKGKHMSNMREVEKVIPRNANHALNILNAAARDEPVKYLSEDLDAAALRVNNDANVYGNHFSKFKPMYAHPLPTSRPRYDAERMMKKLNNMPRQERVAAATSWGLAWCIEELYMQGCPVSQKNATGFTPLHVACRFDFIDCVTVLMNIGLEPTAGIDVNDETMNFLTPLEVAISSNSAKCAAYLASKGGLRRIERPIEGYRSILDVDHVTKFPWLPKMGQQPDDFYLKRVNRAVDDQARNLGMSVEMMNGNV